MVNQSGNILISLLLFGCLITNLIKSSEGAYYGYNQNLQDLVDNEDLIGGYEAGILSQKSLQEIGNLRDDNSAWEPEFPRLTEDSDWLKNDFLNNLGQVAGISSHKNDTLYIFHRGNHIWDHRTFDLNEHYKHIGSGPIPNDTVVVVDTKTGKVIKSWGANKFYLPHGISLDKEGNIWLTDVALQQVFRFKKDDLDKPDLILGQPFQPGHDFHHFCLPTDVAVASSGLVYISDGYCNRRILIVSPSGTVLDEIGIKDNLFIPHSLVLLEEENLICVADRENRRILCYTAGLDDRSRSGILTFNVNHPRLNRVFAVDHVGDVLFALSVPNDESQSEGVTLDLATERIIDTWKPASGFGQPHDITVSLDKKSLFVSDIDPKSPKIYKFNM